MGPLAIGLLMALGGAAMQVPDLLRSMYMEPRTAKLQEKAAKSQFAREMEAMGMVSSRSMAKEKEALTRMEKMRGEERQWSQEDMFQQLMAQMSMQQQASMGGIAQQAMGALQPTAAPPLPGMGLVDMFRGR